MGRPTAMPLSLKDLLRTLEAHHEAYQSMISAVLQTAKNNLSGPPGEIYQPCPNYQRWQSNNRQSRWRILLKDADSVKMLPQVTMSRDQTYKPRRLLFSESRSDATLEEGY
ncbi:hypothetical protein J6590_088312 [Homalodisca vitripennis]|nr:hypothetical protein J6590_088312 [Homalodisca vitripennis]